MTLSKNKGGFVIKSLKNTTEHLRLGLRYSIKNSKHEDIRQLWKTPACNLSTNVDALLSTCELRQCCCVWISFIYKKRRSSDATCLVTDIARRFINLSNIMKPAMSVCSSSVGNLPAATFKFVSKPLLNQLPTAVNLVCCAKSSDSKCPLCFKTQSNKHALSKWGSLVMLERYRHRYDDVLKIVDQ